MEKFKAKERLNTFLSAAEIVFGKKDKIVLVIDGLEIEIRIHK